MNDLKPTSFSLLLRSFATLSSSVYPETFAVISGAIDLENSRLNESEMSIACQLMGCDGSQSVPRGVAAFMVSTFRREIAHGNPEAMLNLGIMHYLGRGVHQDYHKAVALYTSSARLGNLQALENLGYCYYYGRGLPIDYAKAFQCFVRCSRKDMVHSLYKLGDMYRYGQAVRKSEALAHMMYTRASDVMTEEERPDAGADVMRRLGDCALEGIGMDIDPTEALVRYHEAEYWYYVKIRNGSPFASDGLKYVLTRQEEARKKILSSLPQNLL